MKIFFPPSFDLRKSSFWSNSTYYLDFEKVVTARSAKIKSKDLQSNGTTTQSAISKWPEDQKDAICRILWLQNYESLQVNVSNKALLQLDLDLRSSSVGRGRREREPQGSELSHFTVSVGHRISNDI